MNIINKDDSEARVPPNILFVLSDDQGAWALGYAGNPEIETPNLDRLADSGMRFANFFCASPVCSPARATLLTGRLPSQHGIHDWIAAGDTVEQYEPARSGTLIEYLHAQVGYTDLLASSAINAESVESGTLGIHIIRGRVSSSGMSIPREATRISWPP